MKIILLTGGNIGDVDALLQAAVALIEQRVGNILKCSSVFESEPWGFQAEQNFKNQVVIADSELEPLQLLDAIQEIEKQMGRQRDYGNGAKRGDANTTEKRTYHSRTMDIDVLFYGDQIINSQRLTVPHPLIQERAFVLEPLNEIMPEYLHPKLKSTISELYTRLRDNKNESK